MSEEGNVSVQKETLVRDTNSLRAQSGRFCMILIEIES